MWSGTADFDSLAAYFDTHRRLQLADFSCQLSGEYTQEHLLPELRRFVAQDTRRHWTATDFYPGQELVASLSKDRGDATLRHPTDTLRLAHCRTSLTYIATRQPAQASQARFWQQWLHSSGGYWRGELRKARGQREPVQNLRDRLMADNLLYLNRQAEHPKLIVWAASYHVANHLFRRQFNTQAIIGHVARSTAFN